MRKTLVTLIIIIGFTLVGCGNNDKSQDHESIGIIDITTTLDSIDFSIFMPESDIYSNIIAIKLFNGNDLVETLYSDSIMIFSNLYSGTHYTIKLEAEYDDGLSSEFTTEFTYYEVYTEGFEIPVIEIKYVESGEEYIHFKVILTDNDNVGSMTLLELYDGDTLVDSTSDFSKRTYYDLNVSTEYTIRATYTYNLDDALGEQLLVVEYVEKTKSIVLTYFLEIALGAEFGNSPEITRKWVTPMTIFIKGDPSDDNLDELDNVIAELNELMTDGMNIFIVDTEEEANMIMYLGSQKGFSELYPGLVDYSETYTGFGTSHIDELGNINGAEIFINTVDIDVNLQKHTIREELTQSLGLRKDSYEYTDSIFYQNYSTVTSFMDIDKALIWILYRNEVISSLNEEEVSEIIEEIIKDGIPDFN